MNLKSRHSGAGGKVSQHDKDAARQCLLLADKFLKELNFEKARAEVEKAEKLDPSNVYIYAFKDRISHFEKERQKETPQKKAEPAPKPPESPKQVQKEAEPPSAPPASQPPQQVRPAPPPAPPKPAQKPVPPKPPTSPQKKQEAPPPKPAQPPEKQESKGGAAPPLHARPRTEPTPKPEPPPPEPPRAAPPPTPPKPREVPPPKQRDPELDDDERASSIQKRLQSELAAAMEQRKRGASRSSRSREDEEKAERDARVQRERDAALAEAEEKRRQQQADLLAAAEKKRAEQERKAEVRKQTQGEETEGFASKEEQRRPVVDDDKIKELIEKVSAEEIRKREEEHDRRKEAEEKQRELIDRLKEEEKKRKEIESRVADEERKRRELEELAQKTAREREELELLRREEDERRMKSAMADQGASVVEEQQGKIEEMRKQVDDLTKALEQEKKAREEIKKQHLDTAVTQLRAAMRKAWEHGTPTEEEETELRELSKTLAIPPEVEQSIQREVKLEMYSNAVKEVLGKKKLWRSSSNTLEWLRKVYQVSMAEYLENESKFLLDLMTDQYRGTVLMVMNNEQIRQDLTGKLKASGFAVVQAGTVEEALEKIEKISPNFILSQVTFGPGELSGVKFLHLIRVNPKINFLPFVFLGDSSEEDEVGRSNLRPNEGFVDVGADFTDLMHVMNEKMDAFRNYIASLS